MSESINSGQRKFLKLLAGHPEPTRFEWAPKPYGMAMKATARDRKDGVVVGYRTATLPEDQYRELSAMGMVKALSITKAGLRALTKQ